MMCLKWFLQLLLFDGNSSIETMVGAVKDKVSGNASAPQAQPVQPTAPTSPVAPAQPSQPEQPTNSKKAE
jgi:hypothetical protein